MLSLAEKHKISMDLSVSHLVYDEEWDSDDNCLSKFDLTYRYRLGDHVSLLAGPSLNWYTSENSADDSFVTPNIPSHAHTFNCDNNQNWMWIGFNAGLSYRF